MRFYAVFTGLIRGQAANIRLPIRSKHMDWIYLLQLLGFGIVSIGFIRLAEKLSEEKE